MSQRTVSIPLIPLYSDGVRGVEVDLPAAEPVRIERQTRGEDTFRQSIGRLSGMQQKVMSDLYR